MMNMLTNHRVIAATQFHENTNQQLQRVHGIRFACDQAVQPFEEDYEETERQAGDNERADLMPEEWSERMIFPSGKHITRKEIEHWDMEGIERSPHWFRAYGMPPRTPVIWPIPYHSPPKRCAGHPQNAVDCRSFVSLP